jgi:soluble lytic murein transglycosylase-like protein
VSHVGATGVLQVTDPTVDFVSKNLLGLDHELNAADPATNASIGAIYMRHLLQRTGGDIRQALIAYNQGLTALFRDGPYPEAQSYADQVLALRPVFAGS